MLLSCKFFCAFPESFWGSLYTSATSDPFCQGQPCQVHGNRSCSLHRWAYLLYFNLCSIGIIESRVFLFFISFLFSPKKVNSNLIGNSWIFRNFQLVWKLFQPDSWSWACGESDRLCGGKGAANSAESTTEDFPERLEFWLCSNAHRRSCRVLQKEENHLVKLLCD